MTRWTAIAWAVWMEMLRRKDAYVLLILLAVMLVGLSSIDVFGLGGAVSHVKDLGLLMAWLFAWILAALAARQLPQEEARGTVFSLLAKPVSRLDLLAGKWLGSWIAVCAATLCFYVLVLAIVALRGGHVSPATALQAFLLHAAGLAVVTALATALSVRLNADAAATLTCVLTAAAFLLMPRVPQFLALTAGPSGYALFGLYYLMPHFELFDMRQRLVHDWGPAPWSSVALVLLYGALLTAALLALAWLGYRRKQFNRGAVL